MPDQNYVRLNAIAVYEMGEHGTRQKLIRELSLKK